MVEDAMVVNTSVLTDKIKGFVDKSVLGGKRFSLIMLIVDQELSNTQYTLFVSATWLDMMSPREAVIEIISGLEKHLSSNELSPIERVTVIRSDDEFVKQTNQYLNRARSKTNVIEVTNYKVAGISIEKAFIIKDSPLN